MSKTAILADIHANLPAMQAVLAEATALGCERVLLGGDLVGYGEHPVECIRLAMQSGFAGVAGNHEKLALGIHATNAADIPTHWRRDTMMASLIRTAAALSPDEVRWLAELPYFRTLAGAILVHASLDAPTTWNYIEEAADALPSLRIVRGHRRHVIFCGHTHVQRLFTDPEDARKAEQIEENCYRIPPGLATVVTVGSVGRPRSDDHDERAAWVQWDSIERTMTFQRTEYAN